RAPRRAGRAARRGHGARQCWGRYPPRVRARRSRTDGDSLLLLSGAVARLVQTGKAGVTWTRRFEHRESTRMTYTALTRPGALAAASLLCLALGGCGESAEDKAKAQVCNARADISKQINTLGGLTLSSGSVNTAKAGFEALGNDLKKIKDAQPKLDPKRKAQVE